MRPNRILIGFLILNMNINLNYIQGVTETTLDFFEDTNGRINPDKDLNIFYEPIKSSSSDTIIGVKIDFTWKIWVSDKWDKDSTRESNHLKILTNDKLSGVISDLSDIFNEINNCRLDY